MTGSPACPYRQIGYSGGHAREQINPAAVRR
jgi:hypothetical protein